MPIPRTLTVDGTPAQVRARLVQALPAVRDLWFTSPRELSRWDVSLAPLYISLRGDRRAVVGPRFEAIRAASFAPQLNLRLDDAGTGRTSVDISWTYPFPTLYLLVFWVGILVIFAQKLITSPPAPGLETFVLGGGWAMLVVAAIAAVLLGAVMGSTAVEAAVPWLEGVLSSDALEEEDW